VKAQVKRSGRKRSEVVGAARRRGLTALKAVKVTIAAWNAFNARSGSIADEYSTL
jgi:hypothetical protein